MDLFIPTTDSPSNFTRMPGSNDTNNASIFKNDGGRKTELYLVMVILSLLSVMGTAGNALVLYVFSKKKDKLVSTLFIIVLAFVDFTTCLIIIPYTIYMEYIDFYVENDFLCKLYQFLITFNIPFSALIMVAIAIDRYFCICHPFLHAMNIQRAKIMIGALGLFAMILGLFVGLMHGVYQIKEIEWHMAVNQSDDNDTYGNATEPMGVIATTLSLSSSSLISENNHSLSPNVADEEEMLRKFVMSQVVFDGYCDINELILNKNFNWYFQKLFMSLYIVCLVIVIVLYMAIYRSVLARRSKRQKQKSKSLQLVLASTATTEHNGETSVEETMLTTANGDSRVDTVVKNGPKGYATVFSAKVKTEPRSKPTRKSTKKDRMHMANLKTAAMLFVVTVVFILTFIPAFLMAMVFVDYHMVVFYMYFANNVANPVIYSFMNKNFRDDLRKLFCRSA